jgi:MoaA/NifB/PqqE/SkfB family radical SAM enzyme
MADVDGTTQEMHNIYRRDTNLENVLKNIKAFASSGAELTTQTILFKHNEEYQEEIKQLCKDHGSVRHTFVKSDRFNYNPKTNKWGIFDKLEYFDGTILESAQNNLKGMYYTTDLNKPEDMK